MRIGLIGHTDHWTEFVAVLRDVPEARIVACSVAAPHESLDAFRAARAVPADIQYFDSPEEMLDRCSLDLVQVATRPDLIPRYIKEAVTRGVPVMAEKPLAMDLETLADLYETVVKAGVPVAPMHAQRADGVLHVVRQAVVGGAIGTPLLSHSQKSYKWRGNRPDWFRTRATFPGIAAYAGIHAFDWLFWILGDRFRGVRATGAQSVWPDYPGCESQAGFLFEMDGNTCSTVTLDYLRPPAAPTHSDARLRIAGSQGVVETVFNEQTVTIINPEETKTIKAEPPESWYVQFVRSLLGQGESFISVPDAFRITEIALKAQLALETGRPQDLATTRFRVSNIDGVGNSGDVGRDAR